MTKHKNGFLTLKSEAFALLPIHDGDGQVLEHQVLPCTTSAEIVAASVAMRCAGCEQLTVWTGDPDGDHVKTGLLFSHSEE